jgi:hypothetical protein
MQNITVEIVDERNVLIEVLDIDFADVIGGVLWRLEKYKERFPWLSSIDTYGLTYFNTLQLPLISAELERLNEEIRDEKLVKRPFQTNYPGIDTEEKAINELEKALAFFKKPKTHEYLKFTGD